MSRHHFLQFETSQFRLKVLKTTKYPTFSQENILTLHKNNGPQQENLSDNQNWQHKNYEFGYSNTSD
ncbi:20158_t:CDS:1, partial [Dentiscutata erythropus]